MESCVYPHYITCGAAPQRRPRVAAWRVASNFAGAVAAGVAVWPVLLGALHLADPASWPLGFLGAAGWVLGAMGTAAVACAAPVTVTLGAAARHIRVGGAGAMAATHGRPVLRVLLGGGVAGGAATVDPRDAADDLRRGDGHEAPTPPSAADIAARGEDPFGDAAIREVYTHARVGYVVSDDGDEDFIDAAMAHSVIDYFSAIYTQSRLLVFAGHCYTEMCDAQVEQLVTRIIESVVSPAAATARRAVAVRQLIGILAHRPDRWALANLNTREIAVFENGVLEIPSLVLRPGRPDDLMTMHVSCEWHPDPAPGPIDRFLATLLLAEEVLPFLQFLGYAMVPGAPSQEKYALLVGVGENGKSRLLLVLAALFRGFSASIPFQDLSEHRFEKSNLYGKMVNLVGDMSATLVKDTSAIKTLSGGDIIHADIKHKTPIEFVNRAKSIVSSNELFSASDHTWGFYRRAMIFTFSRDFREGGADAALRDPGILETLLADPMTLPRLAWSCIQAYMRLRAEGRFAESASMISAREAFRAQNDAVTAFIEEVLVEAPGDEISKDTLYRAFALWAAATGRGVVGAAKFWVRWAAAKPAYAAEVQMRVVGGARVRVVRGVVLDPRCAVQVEGREGCSIPLSEAVHIPRPGVSRAVTG